MEKVKVNDDLSVLVMNKEGIPTVIEFRFNKLTDDIEIHHEGNRSIYYLGSVFREMKLDSSIWFNDFWKFHFFNQTTLGNPDPDGCYGDVMVVLTRVTEKLMPTWVDVK